MTGVTVLDRDELNRWERLTAAMLAAAAGDDPEGFAQVVRVLDRAQDLLPNVAAELRETCQTERRGTDMHYSWSEIAGPLGVTRSAAAQRFSPARCVDTPFPGDRNIRFRFRAYLHRR